MAENEHAFRQANDRIEDVADDVGRHIGAIPFICECPRTDCTEIVLLTMPDYQGVRADPRTFLVAPGHETTHLDGVEIAHRLVKFEHFSLMEKIGDAGDTAEELAGEQPCNR